MTVSTTVSEITFAGNGTATSFNTGFEVQNSAHLTVTVRNDTTLVETAQTLDVDYSVSGVPGIATVTYPISGSPLASGNTLIIERSVPYTQATNLENQGGLFLSAIEDLFDLVVMMVQQVLTRANRAMRAPEGENISDLPPAASRASKALLFDTSGQPYAGTSVTGSPTVSSFMETVLDDANQTAAQTTLGVKVGTDVQAKDVFKLVATSGTSTAFTAAPSDAPSAYVDGQIFAVWFHTANGTAATIDFGPGAKTIKYRNYLGNNVTLPSGYFQGDTPALLYYNASDDVFYVLTGMTPQTSQPGMVKMMNDPDMNRDATPATAWPSSEDAIVKFVIPHAGMPPVILEEQTSSGTGGGGNSSGSWTARGLGLTEVRDPDSLVTVSTDQFTFTKTMWVEWEMPMNDCGLFNSRLYNVTDSTVAGVGRACKMGTAGNSLGVSTGGAAVLANKAYRIEYYASVANATDGLGVDVGSGSTNVHTRIRAYRD